MIIAIGVDLIEIDRIKGAMKQSPRFLARILTSKELAALKLKGMRPSAAAAYFVAKEAVSKVLGTGIGKIAWQEIEILNEDSGAPYIVLHGNALKAADERRINQILISISHDQHTAVAYAIGQRTDQKG
jgi:holo-[acyl-carrier protein] synthase